MPRTGRFRRWPPIEPRKGASKAKIPPSEATSQYPAPSPSGTRERTGALSRFPPIDPAKRASPKEYTAPSDPSSQYPERPATAPGWPPPSPEPAPPSGSPPEPGPAPEPGAVVVVVGGAASRVTVTGAEVGPAPLAFLATTVTV